MALSPAASRPFPDGHGMLLLQSAERGAFATLQFPAAAPPAGNIRRAPAVSVPCESLQETCCLSLGYIRKHAQGKNYANNSG